MIKLVVSDIDGTLVPEGTHDINPRLFSVIEKLREKGIQFAAASGRHWTSIDQSFAPVRERIFYIADNGGYMGIHNRSLFVETIPQEAARAFIRDMKQIRDMKIVISCPKITYTDSEDQEFFSWVRDGYQYHIEKVRDIAQVEDEILKVACYYENHIDEVYQKAGKAGYGTYGELTISGAAWMDYTPLCVNKGKAVKVLQESLNIKPEETMAFGDQLNDIEMMEQAYYSFAVSNGREEVRKAARFQADESSHDGVIKVLEYLL